MPTVAVRTAAATLLAIGCVAGKGDTAIDITTEACREIDCVVYYDGHPETVSVEIPDGYEASLVEVCAEPDTGDTGAGGCRESEALEMHDRQLWIEDCDLDTARVCWVSADGQP